VDAPRARVYRALLDAQAVARWMVPDGMTSRVHAFDPRPGGSFRISLTRDAPTGAGKTTAHTDTFHGRFVELVPGERLVEVVEFETADPAMQGEMTIAIALADAGGGTDVLWIHDGLPPGLSPADNELGSRMALAKLAALVEAGQEETDRELWNARYAAREERSAPSPFLDQLGDLVPRSGRALDLAGGAGRHALWLARRGLEVTLADVSDVAIGLAEAAARAQGLALATVRVDLLASAPPPGPWDLVLCTYFLHRPLFALFPHLLAPGGVLVFSHATRKNLERHPRPGPDHLLDDGELASLVRGLEVLRLEEGWTESGRHEARLVARRAGR
jgi:uncharacterized protein YndB with AHSA1/START domain